MTRSASADKPRHAERERRAAVTAKLLEQGYSNRQIAKQVGCTSRTIDRLVPQIVAEKQSISEYRTHRADVLADLQRKAHSVMRRVLDSFSDADLSEMTGTQRAGLLRDFSIMSGTMFDKERLERGQSTSNIQALLVMAQKNVDSVSRQPIDGADRSEAQAK